MQYVLIVFVLMLSSVTAHAGDFKYSDNGDGTCTITGYTGDSAVPVFEIKKSGADTYDAIAFDRVVKIPDVLDGLTVTAIGDRAFENCCPRSSFVGRSSDKTGSITIPDSVTSIGKEAFIWTRVNSHDSYISDNSLPGLTSIIVDPNNPAYSSLNGVLFNKAQTELICYPIARIGNYTIPNSVTTIKDGAFYRSDLSITIPNGITDIGNKAFWGCPNLSGDLKLPNSVTTIGDSAFAYCRGLTSVSISDSCAVIGKKAFYNCSGLKNVIIPDSVTSIEPWAFSECIRLTGTLRIPDSVSTIGDAAFSNCRSLKSVIIPDSVISIGGGAFSRCSSLTNISIPDSVSTIGDAAFSHCSHLEGITIDPDNPAYSSVDGVLFNKSQTELVRYPGGKTGAYTIPDGVTSIGDQAFAECRSLTGITIPDSVTSVGNEVFSGCRRLTTIKIPNNVTGIGDKAFWCCGDLKDITIPDSVISIGNSAFSNCRNLKSCTIPDSVTTIGDGAFANCGLTNITIPDSVTSIGKYTFSRCSGLTGITIPNSVTSIGKNAFDECTALTNITIPNSVTTIGTGSFARCRVLADISIGSAVNMIGDEVFYDCCALTSITLGSDVTSIGNHAFRKCSRLNDITVDPDNPVYSSVEGVLFNKTQTKLIQYPPGKAGDYTIPDSVTTIEDGAFYECRNLTGTVIIPDGITGIGAGMFLNCTRLTGIVISDSVKTIWTSTFNGCSSLSGIYFKGDRPRLDGYDNFPFSDDWDVFENIDKATVYYRPETKGWKETYGGRPTAPWPESTENHRE